MRRWVLLLAVVATAGGSALAIDLTTRPQNELTLDSLPEGVSAHQINGVGAFLAREGRTVGGFLDSAHHLPKERLWWCQREGVFVSSSRLGPLYGLSNLVDNEFAVVSIARLDVVP
jgi:hypothetical protein